MEPSCDPLPAGRGLKTLATLFRLAFAGRSALQYECLQAGIHFAGLHNHQMRTELLAWYRRRGLI